MKRNINHIIAAMGMALGVLSLSSCITGNLSEERGGAWADQFLAEQSRWNILANSLPLSPHHLEYLRRDSNSTQTGVILARCTCAICSARISR